MALADVLRVAGAPTGKDIYGPVSAEALVATAVDEYPVLLADRYDGHSGPHEGYYQVVVPLEKSRRVGCGS
jgi:hypothetical protein